MTDNSFKSFGVRARQDRQQEDFYETDPFAVKKLIEKLAENYIPIPATIIDSSVGRGAIAKVFEDTGRKVIGYDIVDRGWQGTILKDYRFVTERCVPKHETIMIVENPPFKHSQQFIEHGLNNILQKGEYLCSLQRIQFLESKSRKSLFNEHPPKFVFIFSERIKCEKDGIKSKNGSMMCYAWFVWEKGYHGNTILKWI